jgi:hypothetical protein
MSQKKSSYLINKNNCTTTLLVFALLLGQFKRIADELHPQHVLITLAALA